MAEKMDQPRRTASAPKDAGPQVEVKALACPKCGGTIDGPGKCPWCQHFLVIYENSYIYLELGPKDYEGVTITPPRQMTEGSYWSFEYKVMIGKKLETAEALVPHNYIFILGKGDLEFGSMIAATWLKKNGSRYGLPGQPSIQVGELKEMKDFVLLMAMTQDAMRS